VVSAAAALLLAGSAAGCGPSIDSARFNGAPRPQPRTAEVQIFSAKLPECAFEELGIVTGKRRVSWTSLDEVLEALRVRAREMGGDAIVRLGASEAVEAGVYQGGANVGTVPSLSGTVIRFSNPGCVH
jgi:hypothetical protein